MQFTERYLTIVLLDLIGSTDFVQRAGAMRGAQWLQYHDRLARSLVYKFDGREIDRSDGFLLSFERPVDAVNFALIYQQTIPAKTKLHARIGIHCGKIVEVKQDELSVMAGAKSVELEGIAKNIAARTMSLCQAGQVLLTAEAMKAVKGRTNGFTPRGTRYAMAGEYRFKGVRQPQLIYTVGATIESLQPPPSSEKAKRLAGPKKIKARLRDREFREWLWWFIKNVALMVVLWWVSILGPILLDEHARRMSNLTWVEPFIKPIMILIEPIAKLIESML